MTLMVEAGSIARRTVLGVLTLFLLGTGYAAWHCAVDDTPGIHRLADGTIASFAAGTRVAPASGFPAWREVMLSGKALLKVINAKRPLIISTHLMRLEVVRPSTLLVTARSRQSGEEVQVLAGEVLVSKNYPSDYGVVDDLHAGEMSMANRTIDFLEKETIGARSLAKTRKWSKSVN